MAPPSSLINENRPETAELSTEPPPPTPPEQRPIPRPDMAKVKAIRPHVGVRKTVGIMTTSTGREVGGEIWSGKDGPGRGGTGLAAPWRHMETMTEHVEGHVAATIRTDEKQDSPVFDCDAVLYISRPPCETEPYGCRWQVEEALPAGARLTVYTVARNGSIRQRDVFIGNGRGLSNAD